MPAIEEIRRKQQEKDLAANPEKQEIKGPTVKEILADKTQNELFGLYLEQAGDAGGALGIKLKSGEIGRDEIAALGEQRDGFLRVLEQSKNTLETLDVATLKGIIETTPELKALGKTAGADGMRNAIARYLPKMAILDRERFTNFSDRALQLKETRKAVAEENKKIKELCRKYDIDEKEYIEAIASGDKAEVVDLVRENMGFFRKIWSRVSLEANKFDKTDVINRHIEQLDLDLQGVGSVLEMALMDNEILREALVADLTKQGEAPKLEEGMSFSEVKRPKDEEIQRSWQEFGEEYSKKHGFNPALEEAPDEYYQDALSEFTKEYSSKGMGGKKGFWAKITELFWSSMIKNAVEKK